MNRKPTFMKNIVIIIESFNVWSLSLDTTQFNFLDMPSFFFGQPILFSSRMGHELYQLLYVSKNDTRIEGLHNYDISKCIAASDAS